MYNFGIGRYLEVKQMLKQYEEIKFFLKMFTTSAYMCMCTCICKCMSRETIILAQETYKYMLR